MPKTTLPPNKTQCTALAALTLHIADRKAKEIQLLPAGEFAAVDGRPATIANSRVAKWKLDAVNAQEIINALNAKSNSLVIDYEHQTLFKEKNGQPAPAAGWFKKCEWREGVGLFAVDVEWTPAAALAIEQGEYKFISPVIKYDANTGRVTGLSMAALTNFAGIDGMAQAQLSDTSYFLNDEGEMVMNKVLLALLSALGLDDKADETKVTAALTAFLDKSKKDADAVAALTSKVATTEAALSSASAANAGAPITPDPAKFVPIDAVQAMQVQMTALSAQVNGREVNDAVQAALTAGKLLPAQEKWARELGASNMAALTSFIASAPAVAAVVAMQTANKPVEIDGVALSSEELAVAEALGQTPEVYAKGKKQYAS